MNYFKKALLLVFICIIFLCPQKADAGTISNAVDKGINYTAKATYYVTKYTLKAGWFVIKKTAKGVKVISKSIFNGTKDAFSPNSEAKPVNKKSDYIYTLPPAPKIN
jgi:hypothetical protein